MSLHEDLLAVAALLRRGHCKGSFARDADGEDVTATSRRACSWCLIGAVQAVTPPASSRRNMVLEAVCGGVGGWIYEATEFSDEHTQAEVVALVERAAAKAKGGA